MSSAYLVGIAPPSTVAERLQLLKRRVLSRCGPVPEVKVTPHITLNLNLFKNPALMTQKLSRLCLDHEPITLQTKGVRFFPKTGHQTVAYVRITSTAALRRLQKHIAEELCSLHEGELLREHLESHNDESLTDKQRRTSKKYGYPYVGNDWLPHMTIAFLPDSCMKQVRSWLHQTQFKTEFTANALTLFKWNRKQDNWVQHTSYKLGTKKS